jgi:hypothetical protein
LKILPVGLKKLPAALIILSPVVAGVYLQAAFEGIPYLCPG